MQRRYQEAENQQLLSYKLFILFFVFYSPYVYATIRFNVTKNFNIGQNILWEITETEALINSNVNPLLCYWKMRSIRRAVKNLLRAKQVAFLERVTEFSNQFD